MMFIFLKFPQLFHTVLLILRKKQVIFLHWNHHVSVSLSSALFMFMAHHYLARALFHKGPPLLLACPPHQYLLGDLVCSNELLCSCCHVSRVSLRGNVGIYEVLTPHLLVRAKRYFSYLCTNIELFEYVSVFAPFNTTLHVYNLLVVGTFAFRFFFFSGIFCFFICARPVKAVMTKAVGLTCTMAFSSRTMVSRLRPPADASSISITYSASVLPSSSSLDSEALALHTRTKVPHVAELDLTKGGEQDLRAVVVRTRNGKQGKR